MSEMNKLLWSPLEIENSQAWKFMQEANQKYNQDGFPINIEITFLSKRFSSVNYKKNFKYPLKVLDYPNNPNLTDLEFIFNE